MIVKKTELEGLYVILTPVYKDSRGYLFESYTDKKYKRSIPGLENFDFIHELVSVSNQNVFRGLHYQKEPDGQGKLAQVLNGEVLDVVIDIRKNSETFGEYYITALNNEVHEGYQRQLWIPPGFAHGFLALTDDTVFHYKCTHMRVSYSEHSISPFGFNFGWDWDQVIMSEKDKEATSFDEFKEKLDEEI